MKTLHLIDTLAPGGAQIMLKTLFENQPDKPSLYCYALRTTPTTVSIRHPNVQVDASRRRLSLSPLQRLRRLIKENDIHVLHCHLPRAMVFGTLLKKLYFKNLVLVLHEHGDIFEEKSLLPWCYRRMHPLANRILACSDTAKRYITEKAGVPAEKIQRIYSFVDTRAFNEIKLMGLRTDERMMAGLPRSTFVFGFAARLIQRKGWQEFLEAARHFKADPDVKFLIAGEGADGKALRETIAEYGLEARVMFPGYFHDVLKFYAMIDALVVPSHWEPLGMTVLEAMAMKIPVIAADVDGLNEVVETEVNGLLFPPKKVNDLIRAMQRMMDEPTTRAHLTRHALRGINTYSYLSFMEQLDQLYQELLPEPNDA